MATLVDWKLFVNEKEIDNKSKFYESLVKEAPFEYGDHGVSPSKNNMSWIDPELVKKGQHFVRHNFFSIMFAHFISLMLIFSFKSGRAVLLRTGESHRRTNSVKRYLSTVLHIKLWYETDFATPATKTAQDVYAVRKMHGAAARSYTTTSVPEIVLDTNQSKLLDSIKSSVVDLPSAEAPWKILTDKPDVPMSQFDMVVTQFCFLGFVVLYPQMWGIWNTEGIEGFIHLWAVIGRLLGIEDKYNLALNFKDRKGYYQIWKNIFIPELKSVDGEAIVMWDSLIYGLKHYTPFLNLNSTLYFIIHDVALIDTSKCKPLFGLMTNYEKFCYYLMIVASRYLLKLNIFRMYLNIYQRFWIFYARIIYMRGGVHTGNTSPDV